MWNILTHGSKVDDPIDSSHILGTKNTIACSWYNDKVSWEGEEENESKDGI